MTMRQRALWMFWGAVLLGSVVAAAELLPGIGRQDRLAARQAESEALVKRQAEGALEGILVAQFENNEGKLYELALTRFRPKLEELQTELDERPEVIRWMQATTDPTDAWTINCNPIVHTKPGEPVVVKEPGEAPSQRSFFVAVTTADSLTPKGNVLVTGQAQPRYADDCEDIEDPSSCTPVGPPKAFSHKTSYSIHKPREPKRWDAAWELRASIGAGASAGSNRPRQNKSFYDAVSLNEFIVEPRVTFVTPRLDWLRGRIESEISHPVSTGDTDGGWRVMVLPTWTIGRKPVK